MFMIKTMSLQSAPWILTSVLFFGLFINGIKTQDTDSILANATNDVYGNDVKHRSQIIPDSANKIWLLKDRPLPAGELREYYIFATPAHEEGDHIPIRLQIWRPTSAMRWQLVHDIEYSVTLEGGYLRIQVDNENTFYTENGDVIGWTLLEPIGLISMDYSEASRSVAYRTLPSNSWPVLDDEYEFTQEYPGIFSIAVKIQTTPECGEITAHSCVTAVNLPYNATSMPNFFGQYHQADAEQEIENEYSALRESGCSMAVDEFICMLYVPECGAVKRYPCSSWCEALHRECDGVAGIAWPEKLDCSLLPEIDCLTTGCDPSYQFTCDNEECIFSAYKCDGDADCTDASDENPQMCATTPCRDDQFECTSNRESRVVPVCIDTDAVCNEEVDCLDGEDEDEAMCSMPITCPPGEFQCSAGECIPQVLVCDHRSDCGNAIDEEDCEYTACDSMTQYECFSHQCIDASLECDGVKDCFDGTDEVDPHTRNTREECRMRSCSALEDFTCDNGNCILASFVCNNVDNCGDNSDEDEDICESLGQRECDSNPCSHFCNETLIGYICSCRTGYRLADDSDSECVDAEECNRFPQVCSQKCNENTGSYTCSCDDGYRQDPDDPSSCTAGAGTPAPWMMFGNELYIRRYDFDAEEEPLSSVTTGHTLAHVVDYDYDMGRIYYADARRYKISSMDFDGGNVSIVNEHQTLSVEGLAVDWIAKNVYWTSSSLNGIYVVNSEGSFPHHLIKDTTDYPRALALDPRVGYLFWTDWGLEAFIGRVGMDGSQMQKDIISNNIFWPNGITIDYSTKRIYWIDAHLDRIESSDYDGNNRFTIFDDATFGYAIEVFEDTVFWSEWNLKRVESANKRDGSDKDVVLTLAHRPFGIHVVHKLRQPEHPNPCAGNPCDHLCLISPGGDSYQCKCTNYYVLQADNRTCLGNCNEAQFDCGAPDHRCLPRRWFCDGDVDCKNGSDEPEDHELCQARTCRPGYIQCDDGITCITPSQVCDTRQQCPDGDDELPDKCDNRVCAPYEFRCDSGQCTNANYKCDGEADCRDGSDENLAECSKAECTEDEFTCSNGGCIPMLWYCDWDDDCGDGSDEPREWCWNNTSCMEGWVRCSTNYRCVPELTICDGNDNCRDNSDEDPDRCSGSCPSGDYTCADGGCIPMRWKCDFAKDCDDGSDEGEENCPMCHQPTDLGCYRSCTEGEFQCNNSRCLRPDQRCDQTQHCPTGEDELGCESNECNADTQFQCDSGHCIRLDYRCDRFADCDDGSDESATDCPLPAGGWCPSFMFTCNKTAICTLKSYVCDGYDDCYDNTDEEDCEDFACHDPDKFQCNSGHCIYGFQVCDGTADCADGGDEATSEGGVCHHEACEFGEFKCKDSTCIAIEKVCDRRDDCGDASDEILCFRNTTCLGSGNNGGCESKCNDVDEGYFCSCPNAGYAVSPRDPTRCVDFDQCASFEQNRCTMSCMDRESDYVCQCDLGFESASMGDTICTPTDMSHMYYLVSNGNELLQVYAGTGESSELVYGQRRVDAMDVDVLHRIVYYVDSSLDVIKRAAIPYTTSDLGNPQDFEQTGTLSQPSGLAYEWKGRLVFWSDRRLHTISAVTDDDRYKKTIILGDDTFEPEALVVDSEIGHLYWINQGGAAGPKIEKSWTNGVNREILVDTGLEAPTSLAIDHYQNHRLYWCDIRKMTIESIAMDGTDRVIVLSVPSSQAPFSLDVFASSIYWTSKAGAALYTRAKKPDGRNVTHEIVNGIHGAGSTKIFHPSKYRTSDPVTNQCRNSRGRNTCDYMCFALPDDGYDCGCPDNGLTPSSSACLVTRPNPPKPLPMLCLCSGHGECILQAGSDQAVCNCDPGFTGDTCLDLITTTTTTTPAPPSIPGSQSTTTTTTTSAPSPATSTTTSTTTTTPASAPASSTARDSATPAPHKSSDDGGNKNKTAAIVVPIVIILILLIAVFVAIVFWMRHNKQKQQGRYIQDPSLNGYQYEEPGVENANGAIQFEKSGVHFNNQLYDTGEAKEEMGGQAYTTISNSDVNLNLTEDGHKPTQSSF